MISCSGSIMALLDYETTAAGGCPTMGEYCFMSLFKNNKKLASAPRLPAMTVPAHAYNSLFFWCKALEKAPELPATTLGEACYKYMFYSCGKLVEAPDLPAITLPDRCYEYMFELCVELKILPVISATVFGECSCASMFVGSDVRLGTTQSGDYQVPWSMGLPGTDKKYFMATVDGVHSSAVNMGQTYYQHSYAVNFVPTAYCGSVGVETVYVVTGATLELEKVTTDGVEMFIIHGNRLTVPNTEVECAAIPAANNVQYDYAFEGWTRNGESVPDGEIELTKTATFNANISRTLFWFVIKKKSLAELLAIFKRK